MKDTMHNPSSELIRCIIVFEQHLENVSYVKRQAVKFNFFLKTVFDKHK